MSHDVVTALVWLAVAFWLGWEACRYHRLRGLHAQTIYLKPGQTVQITAPPEKPCTAPTPESQEER